MAGRSDGTSFDRTVLPPPDPPFRGKIEVAFKDSKADWPEPLRAPKGAPNVLLIMGDDIGYGHMSAFGGPANTPTFDRLAKQGLTLHQLPHHGRVRGVARRVAHRAQRPCRRHGQPSRRRRSGSRATTPVIPRSAATVLEILRQNGYGTAWIGKTHLTPMHEITSAGPFDRWPSGMGAEYFYGFFGPGVSQWYPPLWENTTPMQAPKTPEEGYHLEADMADKTIAWIQRQKIDPSRQAVDRLLRPERAQAAGRRARASSSRSTGASSTTATTSSATASWRGRRSWGSSRPTRSSQPRPEAMPAWDELTDTDKKVGARWMEVFCGAVEHTDYQIGRIVEAIEQTGELDNTLIIYIAGDNGPTPEGGLHGTMNKLSYFNGVPESLDDLAKHIDDFGGPKSHGCYPAAWAYATSTPFTYGKDGDLGRGQQHGRW